MVVTSHLSKPDSACAHQLSHLHDRLGPALVDVVATTGDLTGFHRLRYFFTAEPAPVSPLPAPWWSPGRDRTLFNTPIAGDPHA